MRPTAQSEKPERSDPEPPDPDDACETAEADSVTVDEVRVMLSAPLVAIGRRLGEAYGLRLDIPSELLPDGGRLPSPPDGR
jgi:hypothetical protein